jgi:hypothetical protein
LVLIFAVAAPPTSDWHVWYFYGIMVFAIFAVATVPFSAARQTHGTSEFLRRLQPRTKQARWERFVGVRLVLDNGLTFQRFAAGGRGGPVGFLFTAFIAEDGSVLKPNLDDAMSWATSFRPLREKVGMVTRKKGPPESQAALENIRLRLGAKRGFFVLDGHASSMDLPSTSPRWMAAAVFFDNKWYTKGEQVLAEIDENARLPQSLAHTGLHRTIKRMGSLRTNGTQWPEEIRHPARPSNQRTFQDD